MRVTKRQLRQIIKEEVRRAALILSENKMLDIITNPYEPVEDINVLANYALRDDMQGALKDPALKYYIDKNEASMLVDDSRSWIDLVGDEKQLGPAPEGWDVDKVYDFVERFEDEAYKVFSKKEKGEHNSLPAKKEREVIGSALFMNYVMPDEIKGIEFQVRRKGGVPSNINIEDDRSESNISADDAKRAGVTLDDIVKVLIDGGAKERKKQQPRKFTPSMYD